MCVCLCGCVYIYESVSVLTLIGRFFKPIRLENLYECVLSARLNPEYDDKSVWPRKLTNKIAPLLC